MKYCIVENNVVTNVIEVANETTANEIGAIYLGENAGIGDTVTNGVIVGKEPISDSEKKASLVRQNRDELLAETDWWAVSDRTMTAEEIAYRQALRDITLQESFPDNVVYPTKP